MGNKQGEYRNCINPLCGKAFYNTPSGNRIYCTKQCSDESNTGGRKPQNHTEVCQNSTCGKMFRANKCKKAKYCSRACVKGAGVLSQVKPKERKDPQVCTRCSQSFPLSMYPLDRKGLPALRCKDCFQTSKEVKFKSLLKQKFGITLEAWIELFHSQDGKCVIHKTPLPTIEEILGSATGTGAKNFATDHDHKTGKVRAILCRKCNLGLGCFVDNPEIMRSAAAYLRKHGK